MMATQKFIVITAATCPVETRSAALADMEKFAQNCRDNGAARVTYGSVISGRHPGALIFIQFFDDLDGFETVMDTIPSSAAYGRLLNTHCVMPFSRNIFRGKAIPFEPKIDPRPNYLMLTRARRKSLEEADFLDLLAQTAPTFKKAGAQTMRMGHTFTGSDLGTYMLGVTYPDMASIEATYDALTNDPAYAKISAGVEIDMRSITKIAGIL
tara:strand:+ start:447 stop:1079 length:633 start_codon:yes stop_codon:yes gene_type:complete